MIPTNELLEDIYQSILLAPHYQAVYQSLNHIFQVCINEWTNLPGIHFGGTFAKTDYLLKEYHADMRLRQHVNEARVRLRKHHTLDNEELESHHLYDAQALCQLVTLVTGATIPPQLKVLLPGERHTKQELPLTEYLRVIVDDFDEHFLYVRADCTYTDIIQVCYTGGKHNVHYPYDWSYIAQYIQKGTQLNIIHPIEKNGVLYPELIIIEPDCLMDISAIAACFETYGTHPYIHLINKFKPVHASSAIMMGHLAGQLLDEALYHVHDDIPYKESLTQFFKTHTQQLLTAELAADFHQEAQKQKNNIHKALHSTLPQLLKNSKIAFDETEIIVEPSFYSEMLGLQGRMDFLQLDYKVLIEQKAGKGGWPQHDAETPVQQQKHYVQLLLYALLIRYNYKTQYKQNNHELHSFLLYSKYRNGLIALGFSPELVFEAIKIRNQLAANELRFAHEGAAILNTLQAEDLNTLHSRGTLWENYQKKELTAYLSTIQQAPSPEKDYFLRFFRFLQAEFILSKMGNQSKENSGFADKWYSSVDEKAQAGNIFHQMELITPKYGETGKIDRIILSFDKKGKNDSTNFRIGDIVILYPYNETEEPDATRTMVFRCAITQMCTRTITLQLRYSQVSAHVFWKQGNRKWALEHDLADSSYNHLYRGLFAMLKAPEERRQLILTQREATHDKQKKITGNYGTFNTLAEKVKQSNDLFLIIGPPGTGKTSYGLTCTLQEELTEPDTNILIASYTNRAVDEICSKLVELGIDFIRIGNPYSCEADYQPYLLSELASHCTTLNELKDKVEQTRVVVGTTTAFSAGTNLFKIKQFSLAIIDEASQILEPHILPLLCATDKQGQCAIKKFVMIGDHKQLPAVVQQSEEESAVKETSLLHIGLTNCRLSLFERLLKKYRHHPDVVYMLTKQGRMHQDIAAFPNKMFYNNKLEIVPLPHQTEPAICTCSSVSDNSQPYKEKGESNCEWLHCMDTERIAFIDVKESGPKCSDKTNTAEAKVIAQALVHIYHQHQKDFTPDKTAGVIVPYRNQIAEIRRQIASYDIDELAEITIDTVERFQGSQRDYILYGFTVSKHYQLRFLTATTFEEEGTTIDRKLNVAMTRARKHLLIVGNSHIISKVGLFKQLIDYIKARKSFATWHPQQD